MCAVVAVVLSNTYVRRCVRASQLSGKLVSFFFWVCVPKVCSVLDKCSTAADVVSVTHAPLLLLLSILAVVQLYDLLAHACTHTRALRHIH